MRFAGKRFKKDGLHVAPPGVRVPRKRKFDTGIATRSGRPVRSKYEKRCADFFTEKEIEFIYEPLIILGGRQYRPDFFLPEYNLFVEICGYGHMPYYCDRTDRKEQIYRKAGLDAVFIHYNGKGSLEKILVTELGPKIGLEE